MERNIVRLLLSGNEAIARGAYEAGVRVASGYPGTPSTEILEAIVLPLP
jgi:indolepyruvate ferredoxin oxidoreductase alpha subunit